MREQNDDSPIMPVLVCGGLFLIVVGTIAGFFNIGSFSNVLAILFAFYILWVISIAVIVCVKPDWSVTTQGIVGFIVAIFILIGILLCH